MKVNGFCSQLLNHGAESNDVYTWTRCFASSSVLTNLSKHSANECSFVL